MIQQIINIIGKKQAKKFFVLLIIMFFGSFLEIIGISLIVPLCSILINPEIIMKNEIVNWSCTILNLTSPKQFTVFMVLLLIFIYLLKTVYLVTEYYYQAKFVKICQHEISMKILKDILYRPYEFFTTINAADITRMVYDDINQFASYLYVFLQMITEVLVVICMGIVLFIINPKMTVFCCIFVLILLGIIRFFIKRKVYEAGKLRQRMGKERLKWLNQSVHGIKDIKIGQTEGFFYHKYEKIDNQFIKAERLYQFWTKAPTYCIEALMMICILLYIMILILSETNLLAILPSLSAFALAAVRILPACNRINGYFTQMSYTKSSLELVEKELNQAKDNKSSVMKRENEESVDLNHEIEVHNIDFAYQNSSKKILENAQMKIQIGTSTGIVGNSGSGKTTIIDILLGLLKPQKGEILIDGINLNRCYSSFLNQVAYIPQMIFLIDDSIRNNIAFGIPEDSIDDNKVWKVLKEAKLDDFVRSLPDGLSSQVGERGIRLSGGQRQRIGIARALYSDCGILLFDEATSALDNDTEAAIMDSINYLKGKKTLIIIAHRLSTIEECDIVYKVENGKAEPIELDL